MLRDLRHAVRLFLTTPGLTAAAVLSLGLGIGANSAIFSVASALLLQPLPYADADRLVILWNRSPGLGIDEDWFSTAQYFDIKRGASQFEEVAAAIGSNVNVSGDNRPERVGAVRVSSNLLPMLGARAELGRLFTPEEDRAGAAPVAVLHHGTWMRRYGGDPSAVGKVLDINGTPHRIVGVMPRGFTLPRETLPTLGGAEEAELLLPLPLGPNAADVRNGEDYNILAKLKPEASVEAAQAEMDALTARLREAHPDFYPPNGGLTFGVVPLKTQVVGDVTRPLIMLTAAVAFVLLIACANVANLLLSRALARRREMAVRAALGAGRGRIVRQLLAEGIVLGLAGGAAGLAIAAAGVRAIHALGAGSVPRLGDVAIDGGVFAFTLGVSILSGVLFSLAPALQLGRVDLRGALADGSRGGSGGEMLWGRGGGLRRVLVAGQIALCVTVLVAAGLLVRSFARVQAVEPGFDANGVLTMELTLTGGRYPDSARVSEAYRLLWDNLRALPGVEDAGGVTALPLSDMFAWGPITVEGREVAAGERFINVDQRIAAAGYFETMRIPLVAGRFFTDDDTVDTPRVVVIDQRMAEELWPGQDPVGKRIRTGGFDVRPDTPWMTVIGVTGRVRQYSLDGHEPRIAMYHWHKQRPSRSLNIVMRSATADAAGLVPAARAAIHELDPDLPIHNVKTMQARVETSIAGRRFAMTLLAGFGLLALGLAAIGTYGVMAYVVSQGRREFGIRLALGASPARVARMVAGGGLMTAGIGIIAGLVAAAALTRFMQALLFGVDALDVTTFAVVAGLLATVALLATSGPAWRAARVDPSEALRTE